MRLHLRLLMLLFLVTSLRVGAVADSMHLSEQVDTLFAPWNRPGSPGCAVAVVRDGRIVFEHGYGMANLEYGIPIRPDTPFHVASTSKQFTAFAIHLLANEGKLSLDDDVRKYLPGMHFFGKAITIRHLLHHTSGLRDQWNLLLLAGWRMEDVITEDDVLYLISRQKELNFEPGAEFLYCNTGYTLLAVIVKRVTGKSLNEFCQERIFRPLGMQHTEFHDDNEMLIPSRSYSYHPANGGFANSPLQFATVGPTSLFTTVEDLARWDENFYNARVGGTAVIEAMQEAGTLNDGKALNYASGLILGSYKGLKTVEHNGADAGYRCTLLRFPEAHCSVILLSNLQTFSATDMARRVADLYLHDRLASADAPSGSKPIAKRAETHVDPTAGQLPSSETDFVGEGEQAPLTFVKAPHDGVNTMILQEDTQTVPGQRVAPPILTPAQLAEYVGTYYSDELDVLYTLDVRAGKLWLRHPRRDFVLDPQKVDEFNAAMPIGHVRFTHGATGTEMFISSGRVRNLRFARVEIRHVQ